MFVHGLVRGHTGLLSDAHLPRTCHLHSPCPVPHGTVLTSDVPLVFARDPLSFPLIEIPHNPKGSRSKSLMFDYENFQLYTKVEKTEK